MATTITKTIGTGGDYTDVGAWIAAIPASLVTADEVWIGQLLNQEWTFSTGYTLASKTTDATRYIELTTAPGCSFVDHTSATTNPLRVTPANGATLTMTGTGVALTVNNGYVRINKIQMRSTSTSTSAQPTLYFNSPGGVFGDINQCLIEGYGRNSALKGVLAIKGNGTNGHRIRNSVVVQRTTDTAGVIAVVTGKSEVFNCTLVATGATILVGTNSGGIASIYRNTYIGGVVAPEDAVTVATKTSCYCNAAYTGYTVVPFSTSTFESVTDGSHDFRLKAGSGLIDVGTTDTTYAANGVIGTSRPQGSGYDVGAWEYVTPAAGLVASVIAVSTTTSALTTQIVLSATATAVATSSATIFNSSAIISSVSSTATAAGILSTQIALQSSLAAIAAVTATLTNAGGVITTPVLKNNAGTILANETGVIANVYNTTTGALVVRKTGLTSSAGGVVVISDALIATGTTYAYEIVLTSLGRRLPTAAAT